MKSITIRLPYIEQEIYIGKDLLSGMQYDFLTSYDKVLVVADINAYRSHASALQPLIKATRVREREIVILKPALESKDFEKSTPILSSLVSLGATRKSCIVAIGGGYVGDIVGFSASVYMRGIDFVYVPTTLMGQCDAIIGKVAVNYEGRKNMLGSFYSPKVTICATGLINGLPRIECCYGLVELWKHALLSGKHWVVEEIEKVLVEQAYTPDYARLVNFSLRTKARYVQRDPTDSTGYHKALSMGHTIANILEADTRFRHGLAVFYGIIFELLLARQLNAIGNKSYRAILSTARLFEREFAYVLEAQKILDQENFIHTLLTDKISSHGTLRFAAPADSGFQILDSVTAPTINAAVREFDILAREWTNIRSEV